MDKITFKLTKYFMTIITIIVALCLILSSIFLSKVYLKQQYNDLKASAKEVYTLVKNNEQVEDSGISAILIKGSTVTPLTPGKMGMMPYLRSSIINSFTTEGIFKNGMGAEFLYYKLQTEIGDIVVFQNNKYSSDYLKVVYLILFFIFIFAVILSIPLITFVGKKFTRPIMKLQKAADAISKGDLDADFRVDTKDEIETLSNNLNNMALSLKKKYQLQRDFIANVSHDFKTPLSVIRSCSEAIMDGLVDEKNIESYSGDIIKEVDRLNAMVTELLQLSKLQDGAYSLSKEFINLKELANECTGQLSPIMSKKNISIAIDVSPVEIYADRRSIQRVLYNLVDNAIKFSKEDGLIQIFTSESEDFIKLSVKDFGIGIEQHELEDIWDKYYKNSKSGGMGLGLPICKEILNLHGFKYGVTSLESYGTEFYFIIPKTDIGIKNS